MQRPRPVVTAAGITGLVTSVAGILAFLGYANASAHISGAAQGIGAGVIGLLGLGSHLLASFHVQNQVTPLSDPRDALGRSLKAVDDGVSAVSGYFGVGPVESALARVSSVLETAVHALASSTPTSTPTGSSIYLGGGAGGGGGSVGWSAGGGLAAVMSGTADEADEPDEEPADGDHVEPGGEGSTHGDLRGDGPGPDVAESDPSGKHAAPDLAGSVPVGGAGNATPVPDATQ